MILDFEHELTTAGGQLFDASTGQVEYGTIAYDLGKTTPEDPILSGPLHLLVKVHSGDVTNVTNLKFGLYNATSAAGAGATLVIPQRTVTLASGLLVEGKLLYIGSMDPHQTQLRYLVFGVETTGTAAGAGLLKAWIVPSENLPPKAVLS